MRTYLRWFIISSLVFAVNALTKCSNSRQKTHSVSDTFDPVPLFRPQESGVLVCAEGWDVLGREYADKQVALVTVYGTARTGKSTALNYVLRSLGLLQKGIGGFPVGDKADPETVGLDIWPIPYEKDGFLIFFVDTEGLGRQGTDYDNVISLLASIISSHIILNDRSDFSQEKINFLYSFSQFIQQTSHIMDSNGIQYPPFTWVIQCYTLINKKDPDAYVRDVILDEKVRDPQLSQITHFVKTHFSTIHGVRVPPLSTDTSKWYSHFLRDDEIDENYRLEMDRLIKLITETKPHSYYRNAQPFTGRQLAQMLETYAYNANKGEIKMSYAFLKGMSQKVADNIYELCVHLFTDVPLPSMEEKLSESLSTIKKKCLRDYEKEMNCDHTANEYLNVRNELEKRLNARTDVFIEMNIRMSNQFMHDLCLKCILSMESDKTRALVEETYRSCVMQIIDANCAQKSKEFGRKRIDEFLGKRIQSIEKGSMIPIAHLIILVLSVAFVIAVPSKIGVFVLVCGLLYVFVSYVMKYSWFDILRLRLDFIGALEMTFNNNLPLQLTAVLLPTMLIITFVYLKKPDTSKQSKAQTKTKSS